jgi:LacI family transcriptional regulator
MGSVRRRIAFFETYNERGHRKLAGLLRYVSEQDDLTVADFRFREEELPPSPPWIGRAEGAIVNSSHDTGILDWMRRGGVPFVSACDDLCNLPIVSIFNDPRSVARLAAEHFLDLGFREFVLIGAHSDDSSRDRYMAFSEELAQRGHKVREYNSPVHFFGASEELADPASVDPKITELLTQRTARLAVLAANDERGLVVCRIAESLGLAVPDDVAVLAIGGTTATQIAAPPLSSIRLDYEKIGYEAGRLLHRLMDGKEVTQRHWKIPALGLVARESTVGRERTVETDIDRALLYIGDHACEDITARDVAARLRLALRTFELQFQAEVGHSAAEEIRRVKIERAKSLLANTNLTIAQIAGLVGLNNSSYFAAFFRRHTGMTPGAYREHPAPEQVVG